MTDPIKDLDIGQPKVDPTRPHRTAADGKRRPQVAIFGAGVAGLTAAHELAERGFDVEVFEAAPPSAVEAALGAPCGLGGMARTQYARAETPNNRTDGRTASTEPIWTEPPLLVPFTKLVPDNPAAIEDHARRLWALEGLEGFVVVGYRTMGENPTDDEARADDVARRLRPAFPPATTNGTSRRATVAVRNSIGAVGAVTVEFERNRAVVTAEMARELGDVRRLVRDAVIGQLAGSPSDVRIEVETGLEAVEAPAALADDRAAAVLEVLEDLLPTVETRRGGVGTKAVASLRVRIGRAADTVEFAAGPVAISPAVGRRLDALRRHYGMTVPDPKRPVLLVRGFRAASEPEDFGAQRAAAVGARLTTTNDVSVRTEDGGVAFAGDLDRTDDERRVVTIAVEEDWLPGEHGFRFFPSFYRHVFDSMERIPLLEDSPLHEESPRSVLDNLVETNVQALHAIAPDGEARVAAVPREPIGSLTRLLDVLRDTLATTGTTLTDSARLMLKLFQYMTSCPARRAGEYEHLSWSEFIGPDAFSGAFATLLETAPLALVGLRSRDADARTFGDVTAQLLVDQFLPRPRTDATMNAPTTLGWFLPWRRYLEAQGVVFRHAALAALHAVEVTVPDENGNPVDEDQVWAEVRLDPIDADDPGSPLVVMRDYLVLALPASEASTLVASAALPAWPDGHRLVTELDVRNPPAPAMGRHPVGYLGADLAHLSGIQFYFDADVRCIDGHALYLDAPWRLSAISQPQFWDQQRGWWDGYRGLLSVDVADWTTPHTPGGTDLAWDSTRDQIAQRVWRQIADRVPARATAGLPRPIVFHLDDHIHLDAAGRPARNHAPLLLTRTGRYPTRPGRLDSTRPFAGYDVYGATVGPPLGLGRLVMCGTHMRTRTRLTTMEAANESARHAVNGILEAEGFRGARCRIWDIEDPQTLGLPDLRHWIDLDAELYDRGLPHMVEILDLDAVPQGLLATP